MGIMSDLKEVKAAWDNLMAGAWVFFRRFQFNLNIGDILIVLMLATALQKLYVLDTEFPYITRNPAVTAAQRCEQLLGAKIEGIAQPGCTIQLVCPTANYTMPMLARNNTWQMPGK